MSQHKFFYQSGFGASSGLSITAIAATSNDSGLTPSWSVSDGSFTTDGSGNVVGASGSDGFANTPLPSSHNYDAQVTLTLGGTVGFGFYVAATSGTVFFVRYDGTNLTVSDAAESTTYGTQAFASPGGSFAINLTLRLSGTTLTVGGTFNGSTITPVPITGVTLTASHFYLVDLNGTTKFSSVALLNALPATGTVSGPGTSTAGAQSAAFTATIGEPAPVGGQVVNLASSGGSDTFQAVVSGGNVTTITIAEAATSGTFYVTAASTGARTITPTSSGITFSPATLTLTASAGGSGGQRHRTGPSKRRRPMEKRLDFPLPTRR